MLIARVFSTLTITTQSFHRGLSCYEHYVDSCRKTFRKLHLSLNRYQGPASDRCINIFVAGLPQISPKNSVDGIPFASLLLPLQAISSLSYRLHNCLLSTSFAKKTCTSSKFNLFLSSAHYLYWQLNILPPPQYPLLYLSAQDAQWSLL